MSHRRNVVLKLKYKFKSNKHIKHLLVYLLCIENVRKLSFNWENLLNEKTEIKRKGMIAPMYGGGESSL